MDLLVLLAGGILSGILAGLLGVGGGFLIVSLLVALQYPTIEAVATSSLVIIMSSAASFTNWRMGYLDFKRVAYIAIPAIVFAPVGAYLASEIPEYILLSIFSIFLLTNIFLIGLRQKIATQNKEKATFLNPVLAKIMTGGIAGFLSGLLGVGGGAIMVPLQMLLLNERIKVAIRTSLGVIVAATVSSAIAHAINGHVLFAEGLTLGAGGIIGTQIGTRVLPKLPDSLVRKIFIAFLAIMAIFMFWKAWNSYLVS